MPESVSLSHKWVPFSHQDIQKRDTWDWYPMGVFHCISTQIENPGKDWFEVLINNNGIAGNPGQEGIQSIKQISYSGPLHQWRGTICWDTNITVLALDQDKYDCVIAIRDTNYFIHFSNLTSTWWNYVTLNQLSPLHAYLFFFHHHFHLSRLWKIKFLPHHCGSSRLLLFCLFSFVFAWPNLHMQIFL